MNYYRRYVGDFQRDTGHLSLTDVGAYDRLLDHYYATGDALPDDMDVLCRICRAVTDAEKASVHAVVAQFFPIWKDKKRHNNRADHELAVSKQAKENGGKGGRPRKTGYETGNITGEETETLTGHETGIGGGEAPGSVHPPTTNHQPPTTILQPPTKGAQQRASAAGALSATLRALGIQVTPSNPFLVKWVEFGATAEKLKEAAAVARDRKPAPERIPAAYLDPIVRELCQPKPNGGNGSHHEPVDKSCVYIQNGVRCGKPGAFGNVIGTKWQCREHGPL